MFTPWTTRQGRLHILVVLFLIQSVVNQLETFGHFFLFKGCETEWLCGKFVDWHGDSHFVTGRL